MPWQVAIGMLGFMLIGLFSGDHPNSEVWIVIAGAGIAIGLVILK